MTEMRPIERLAGSAGPMEVQDLRARVFLQAEVLDLLN